MNLSEKVALVTGSTSGIGLGLATALAEKNCSIILTGICDEKERNRILEEFTRNYKGKVDFVPCDLRSVTSIKEFCQRVTSLYPDGIDILINNAGIQHVAPVEEYPDDIWDDMVSVTMTAPFHLIKYFLPSMKRKGWGRIINISSQMGLISEVGKAPYSAAKAGLIGLTKGVALESAPHGITCNAICPGFVYTALTDIQVRALQEKEGLSSFEEAKQKFFSRPPTQQPVEIRQLAELVLFLCSSGANSMTGSPILVDGGFTLQ